MSLINEALKKAQRQRSEEPADAAAAAAPVAGERVTKRSKATSANTMVLLGSGAVVLIVLSVVGTVYLLNRPAPRTVAATPAPAASTTTPPAATPAPAPVAPLVVPVAPPTAATTETPAASTSPTPPSAPAVAPTMATTEPATAPAAAEASAAPLSAPAPAAAKPAPPPAQPDERVAAFVEAIRVTGIRSSGTESRVLMNERVFRVNDLVDRALNLRLVKVATDSLTFADANGVTYVKNF